jgi:hypothetical protein
MVVADLLNMMGVLDNEIDNSKGGTDEARSILALGMATDYFETVAATLPKVLGSAGVNNIKTQALMESSPFPAELLRLDALWALDVNGVPIFPMGRIDEVGGHMPALPWPLNYVTTAAPGQPRGYYPNSNALFWLPVPDQIYNMRAYGLWSVPPYVDRETVFPFPDAVALPLAAFAVKYGTVGLDDSSDEIQKIAVETFTPCLRMLRKRDRSKPTGKRYANFHTT